MPAGSYHLWLTTDEVATDLVSLTIIPQEEPKVSITLLHPNSFVSDGDLITIHGRGFTETDNIVRIGSAVVAGLPSLDGRTILFRAPAAAGTSFIRGINIFNATVTNANGQSNPISLGYR